MKKLMLTGILVAAALALANVCGAAEEGSRAEQRQKAQKLQKDANFKDAFDIFGKLALDAKNEPKETGSDLASALTCLYALNRANEVDTFREKVIAAQKWNWRLLFAAADSYFNDQHWGYIIAGEYHRGHHRGGGRYAGSFERDRVRALQLMVQAMTAARGETDSKALADFYLRFADMLLGYRGYAEAWRLQYLSDLSQLPDYDEGGGGWGGGSAGAAVDEAGNPVYHAVPKSYEAAKSDGERWRWMLLQALELMPDRANTVHKRFADFLHQQFGVQTLSGYESYFDKVESDDEKKPQTGTYALHTLRDEETIARLATGIKRFKFPEEQNFIKIYQKIADNPKAGLAEEALNTLAGVFEDRRQYDRATEYWKRTIKDYGVGPNAWKQKRLDQVLGNWGRFEPVMTHPAGKGATVEFRFRNGNKVHFEAHTVRVKDLLDDVKAYLKTRPGQLDWKKMNISDIGYRLVQKNETKYVGEKVAEWDLDLKPRPMHFDKRITVTTPLQKAGAYLLSAKMADGNTSKIIIWLDDTVIVKKPLNKGGCFFVCDAATGKPVAKANLEFFGYKQEWVRGSNRYNLDISDFSEFTDDEGLLVTGEKTLPTDHSWLIIATTPEGRFAYLGFTGVWGAHYHTYDAEYNATKVYMVTDRPVYRPAQPVEFKFWVRHAKYDEDGADYAKQAMSVIIQNPKGEKVFEKTFSADEYAGIAGEFALPKDAMLGQYHAYIWKDGKSLGGGYFRVEEYKKPEFEVNVEAPTEPVMLGETITAKMTAKYYFGAPVTKARVKYKVQRTSYSANWYPLARWDWFYGRGYWWFACDYDWYPGWKEWGCPRPHWWWWPVRQTPPEIVAEAQVPIGPDGTVNIRIDTALAKEIHGDTDHKYEITVEVTDESRRTIVGSGSVLVARRPFKVYAWVDRGHYRVGDVIRADFMAQTLDNKPVQGDGVLKLFKVSYDKNNTPVETEVQGWDLDTGEAGQAALQMKASEAGQYRLAFKLTGSKKQAIEGGCVFCVAGEGFDSSKFRFNSLELVADKKEYAPGEKAKVMVNTDRIGSTVLLFARPANGVYLPPKVLSLSGKSVTEEIAVTKKDMPNFFVEAVTVSDGKIYTETREFVVPPEKRVLNVDVLPSSNAYKPGEKARVRVKLTDFFGKPFVGSMAMTMYDRALEYISGGSNVPEIKAFFWKWRRSHRPQTESTLGRGFHSMTDSGRDPMNDIGAFGHSLADESGLVEEQVREGLGAGYGSGGFGNGESKKMKSESQLAAEPAARTAAALNYADAAVADRARGIDAEMKEAGVQGGGEVVVQPVVRTKFADTAFWAGSLATDSNGMAEVDITMPENLTGWKIRTWAMGSGTQVGEGEAGVVTVKNLLLRLQAPRFFTEKDEVVLSANVHNYLKNKKNVQVVLELDGDCLKPIDKLTQTITVEANGETRADWRVKAVKEGQAVVRMKALTDEESDAMEMKFPVYVHGMLKTESFSGAMRPEQEKATLNFTVPKERRMDESRLEIRYSPTLAGAMVDALPYLLEYPYGCTEQVLNRFLPAVITQKILMNMGLDLKAIQAKRINLNAQEIGDDAERAKQWKRFDANPVFDKDAMQDIVKDCVKQLTSMQCADGGWGWFSGWGERSYPHTTAYMVHGLQIARDNDVAIVPGVLERGVEWLRNYQGEQIRMLNNAAKQVYPWKAKADDLDAFVFMVLTDAAVKNDEMLGFLERDRAGLAAYGKALYGMALHKLGEKEKLAAVMQNIDQFLVQDEENQTAYLNLGNEGYWWYWYGSEFEAQAYYLKLLSRTDPKSQKASRMVKYLLNNRKHATYWNSTRDTAVCIEAMADYLKASGEDKPNMTVEIYVDGKKRKEVQITAENLFLFDNKFVMFGDAVETGKHAVEFRKKGTGPLYFNAYLSNFTLEDFITKAGLEVKVDRKYYKLTEVDKKIKAAGSRGQAVDQKVEKYQRTPLKNLATLKSGDLVEIELEIESKNDYEYLVFEDMKAGGFEPVQVRSGYNGNDMGAYMELRDERVCFFARCLARGKHSVAYRMRAEIPGAFSALPTKASAMYAPELKANSDEIKLKIED